MCFFVLSNYHRLVFLDLDIVLLQPLDALMAMRMPPRTYLAATGVGGACPKVASWEPFNGGMVVLRPSRRAFDDMMLRLCHWFARPANTQLRLYKEVFGGSCDRYYGARPKRGLPGSLRRFNKVCERFLTDQSLFNLHFLSLIHI